MRRSAIKRISIKVIVTCAVLVLTFTALGTKHSKTIYAATNGRIAYTAWDGVANDQIYSVNSDGSDKQELTNDNYFHAEPTWSPDGTKIAYVADPNSDGNNQIFVMNADGSDKVNLNTNSSYNTDPTWSPDGSKIAFSHAPDQSSSTTIYIMNADGSHQTQITTNANGDSSPSWKPDGTKIVYTCFDGTNDQLCTVSPDGSNQTALTSDAHPHDTPSWSPDGTQIAFIYQPSRYDQQITLIDADGSNQRTVSNGRDSNESVTWSPDGTKLLYDAEGNTSLSVFYINVDGSGETAVTPDGADSFLASWQPVTTPANETTILNPVTSKNIVLKSNCTSNSNVLATALPTGYRDTAFNYTQGLLNFTLNCSSPGTTATVTIDYYGLTYSNTLVLRKYNSSNHTYETIPGATISAVTIGGQNLTEASYQITDGGPLDQDGTANGTIVDPVGIASPAVSAPNTGLGGMAYNLSR